MHDQQNDENDDCKYDDLKLEQLFFSFYHSAKTRSKRNLVATLSFCNNARSSKLGDTMQ